jgi:hypothetical protein
MLKIVKTQKAGTLLRTPLFLFTELRISGS